MRAQGRAAGGLDRAARGSTWDTLSGAHSIADLGLAAHVLAALHAEDIHTLDDWRKLGRRRFAIFGVVPSVIRMLDKAAEVLT